MARGNFAVLAAAWFALTAALVGQAVAAEAGSEASGCGALKDKLIAPDGTIRFAVDGDAYQALSSASTDRCRQAVERNAAPEITVPLGAALVRGAGMPLPDGAVVTAQIALCALRPQTEWAFSWMLSSASQRTAPACFAALVDSDRPEAKRLVESTLDQMFRSAAGSVLADDFVLQAAAYSPPLRERLRVLLPKAGGLGVSNVGEMRRVACNGADRTTALGPVCHPPEHDDGLGQDSDRLARRLTVSAVIVALAAGAIAGGSPRATTTAVWRSLRSRRQQAAVCS